MKTGRTLLQVEWDFTFITQPEQLYKAIDHEFARSCERVIKGFRDWHGRRIQLPAHDPVAKEWNGKTIREVLEKLRQGSVPPPEVIVIVFSDLPKSLWRFALPIDTLKYFPTPFCKVQQYFTSITTTILDPCDWGILESEPEPEITGEPPASLPSETFIIEMPEEETDESRLASQKYKARMARLRWETKQNSVRFPARKLQARGIFSPHVNCTQPKSRLMDEFSAFVDLMQRSPSAHLWAPPRGKAAEPPYYLLKQLAALRFIHAGFKFREARDYMRRILGSENPKDPFYVLPFYTNSSSFGEAARDAQTYMDLRFSPGKLARQKLKG